MGRPNSLNAATSSSSAPASAAPRCSGRSTVYFADLYLATRGPMSPVAECRAEPLAAVQHECLGDRAEWLEIRGYSGQRRDRTLQELVQRLVDALAQVGRAHCRSIYGALIPPTGTLAIGSPARSSTVYGAHVGGEIAGKPTAGASAMPAHITWSPIDGETLNRMLSLTAASAAIAIE